MSLPDIIFLNGSTSAGKSSLARALQEHLPGLWMHLGIDHFIQMSPLKLHDTVEGFQFVPQPDGSLPIFVGAAAERVLDAYTVAVRAIAQDGTGVIIDEVLLKPEWLARWLRALAGIDVFFVGVTCALAEMERREVARGDRGKGQVRSQIDLVHTFIDYDFTVDTTTASPDDCAAAIVAALDRRVKPGVFEKHRAGEDE